MKANEAPEKIWITPSIDLPRLNGVMDKNSIEYIRKDAFIKKACEWIKHNNKNGGCLFDGWKEDFKNYMKGE